jgi:hypothetical protein
MNHAFLQELHKLEDPTAIEIHSSTSQPATNSFLDYVIIIIVLVSHVIFQDPE